MKQFSGTAKKFRKIFFGSLIVVLALIIGACASPEKKIALLIANQDYEDDRDDLTNPVNDIEEIREALELSGFKIIVTAKNLKHDEMNAIISEFRKKVNNTDAAVFYYSGHGIQFNGKNYLVPVDKVISKLNQEKDLEKSAIKLGDGLITAAPNADSNHKRVDIIIVDACRDNQFNYNRGLAEIPLPPNKEVLVAFATVPGSTTPDDGLYAKKISEVIQEFDGFKVQEIFSKVIQRVVEETSKNKQKIQIPMYYTNLAKDFYFLEKKNAKLVFTY